MVYDYNPSTQVLTPVGLAANDAGDGGDIKVLEYTGDGTIPKVFTFDTPPSKIIAVRGAPSVGYSGYIQWQNFEWGDTAWDYMFNNGNIGANRCSVTYPAANTLQVQTPISGDAAGCMNREGGSYTMWYEE